MATSILKSYIEVFGKDSTGRAFSAIGSKLDGIGKKVGNVTSSVGAGVFAAELATRGLDLAIGAVTGSIGAMAGALNEAADLEGQILASTAAFATLGNVDFSTAEESILRVSDRLSVSAAVLPGATKEYTKVANSIIDNVIPAFKGLDGSLDFDGLEDEVVALSESFTALGANAGVQTTDISKGLGKALSGKSISELGELLLFEENPAVLAKLEQALAERNVKSLKDLDVSARVGLIREVGEAFITDEFKDRAADNVNGIIESFKTVLLDPKRGIFGVSRDLLPDLEGDQSVFSGYKNLLKGLIGSNGLFSPTGPMFGLLETLGIDLPNPMLALYNLTQRLSGFINSTNLFLTSLADPKNSLTGVGKEISNLFNGGPLDKSAIASVLGKGLSGMYNRAADAMLNFIDATDMAGLGSRVGKALSDGALLVLDAIPWLKVGKLLFRIPQALANIVSSAIITGVKNLVGTISTAIYDATIGKLTGALTTQDVGVSRTAPVTGRGDRTTPALTASSTISSTPTSAARGRGRRTTARASGFDPATSSDIVTAAMAERAIAPVGSGLIIANDTERVIPRGQPGNDGRPLYPAPVGATAPTENQGGNTTINFSPTVTLAAGSTREQAMEMLGMLQQMMDEQLRTQLV